MDEPDIQIKEVRVEQVVLNKSGKRAIRLDAWAKATDERQFNMEMQNDTKGDDVRKHSSFYQGLMDTPVLESTFSEEWGCEEEYSGDKRNGF